MIKAIMLDVDGTSVSYTHLHIDLDKVDSLSARLAAMGLLGFDLDENSFFYRRLPFKTCLLYTSSPRMPASLLKT